MITSEIENSISFPEFELPIEMNSNESDDANLLNHYVDKGQKALRRMIAAISVAAFSSILPPPQPMVTLHHTLLDDLTSTSSSQSPGKKNLLALLQANIRLDSSAQSLTFAPTKISDFQTLSQTAPTKALSWHEALEYEKVIYNRLKKEIDDGFTAETEYWNDKASDEVLS